MNWDDLKIARAVFQAGSFASAAKQLGVNETTVSRRLARLEAALGASLFEAVDGERRPTQVCREIVASAETVAAEVEKLDGLVNAERPALVRRRIAATDSVSVALLAPHTNAFMRENPGIGIDFLASTENVDFSRWEADVAVRLKRPEKGNFIIRRLADLSLYFVEPIRKGPESQAPLCAYTEDLSRTPEMRYLASIGILDTVTCRSKNLLVLKTLIESGGFRGVLPGFMCRDLVDSSAISLTPLPGKRSAWLMIQSHLRDDAPTRAVVDWISDRFSSSM